MSGNSELEEFLEQIYDNGEVEHDPGHGFNAYATQGGDCFVPYSDMHYYEGEPEIEDYLDGPTLATFGTPVYAQIRSGNQSVDEIEEFESSDPFGYGMSSPTLNQPHGFVAPAALQAPTMSRPTYASQKSYDIHQQRKVEEPEYAYMQPRNTAYGNSTIKHGNNFRSSTRPPQLQQDTRRSNPRNAYNIRLRPVSELPDIYRGVFKFGVFNAVQSKCYQTIMETRENMVVSAPTGAGKTVLFELGLIAMLMDSRHQSVFKCVYVAPTKALCSERTRDWTAKFEPLGIKCCEMTGDTVQMGKSAWVAARNAKIIITTSEKWDSLTRGWHDHGDFLSEVKLFLVDEVHVLNEPRGSTLEVIISRMKARANNIRFILVSATVPNIQDIADWIGNPSINYNASATVYEFGEEYRPCKITRHIYGFSRKNQNDFQFARTLDYKLYSVIEKHACGKPILVFCSTRKGVLSTAEQLLKEYDEAMNNRQSTPWTPPRQVNRTLHDKKLEKLAKAGLGVHHAGLSFDDRRAIEDLYLDGSLRVVCATSTLAVGVNLPAHTVVIKGVKLYMGNAWQEYHDLDVIQMIGRAGRPQFDKEGVAVIMCEQELENKYRNLAQGKTILESSLHENLLEHINSEIGIMAINDIQSAKAWLRNSFLRQRIQKNPGHYHIGKTAGQTWEEKMDDMVLQAVKKLEENELISRGGRGGTELSVTEYGDIMSKYYIRQSTMGSILKLTERPTVREILEIISCAEELGDVRLRGGDKQVYNKMRDHHDIRYKIKKVEKASDKAFLLIQAVLGGISLSAAEFKTTDSQPVLDALSIFRHTARIARVVVEVAIVKRNGAQLKHGLELVRCLTAKAWEDRPVVLKQIETIGEKSLKVLADHGITSLQALRKQEPSRIEMLLNRRPPYGHEVLQSVQDMPQYGLSITVEKNGIVTYSGKKPISIELNIDCYLLQTLSGRKRSKQKSTPLGMTSILTTTSDLEFIDFRRISTKALKEPKSFVVTAELTKPSQSVWVLISSENLAGLTVTQTYKPSVPATEYPTVDTHPKSATDILLESCEQDADFWDDDATEEVGTQQTYSPSPATMQTRLPLEPRTLPNGNYVCNHNCKDKSACRHLCCREGTMKPPSVPKKPLEEKKEAIATSKTMSNKSESTQTKRSMKEDKRLEQLESLHKRTGVNESLRLSDGQRLKLDAGTSARAKLATKPNFDVQFAELKAESDKDEDSPDDMPDSKELLASIQPKDLTKRPASDDSFTDSELDAIMLTVDIVDPPFGSADVSSTNSNTLLNTSPPSAGRMKRKSHNTETSSWLLSPTAAEFKAKKTKLDNRISEADDKPLFLRNSSLSSPPRLTSTAVPDFSYSKYDNTYADEDDFALDESIFNIVPDSVTADETEITPKDAGSDDVSKEEVPQKTTTDTELKEECADVYDYGKDEWADMEDWILNSGSVQIVG